MGESSREERPGAGLWTPASIQTTGTAGVTKPETWESMQSSACHLGSLKRGSWAGKDAITKCVGGIVSRERLRNALTDDGCPFLTTFNLSWKNGLVSKVLAMRT